ncbi:MAG: hypothetical protein IKX88_14940, partial [Thermoguttaceae bacterium]|nr:hypothetical protein [Thermoguttaceae bacterium]
GRTSHIVLKVVRRLPTRSFYKTVGIHATILPQRQADFNRKKKTFSEERRDSPLDFRVGV